MTANGFMTIIKTTVACCLIASLGACASSGKKSASNTYGEGSAQVAQRGSTTSQGIGKDEQFAGRDMFKSTTDEDGNPILQKTFYFPFDSSSVSQSDFRALQQIAAFMKTRPNLKVRLEGNTDERGSREYNIGLGERRAGAVADILRSDGVFQGQLNLISYGAEQPIALGHNEQDYRLNRRVDIILPQS